jgi:hypothetical protein
VGKNLIVKSEVIAGDDVDTSILLDLPVGKTETLGLSEKLSLSELSSPVGLSCLLEVTVDTHTRETEDGSIVCHNQRLSESNEVFSRTIDLRLNHDCGLCEFFRKSFDIPEYLE